MVSICLSWHLFYSEFLNEHFLCTASDIQLDGEVIGHLLILAVDFVMSANEL